MSSIRFTLALAGAAAVLSLAACNAAKDEKAVTPASAAPASETVATVNGTPVSKSRIDMLVKQGGAQGQPDSPDTRKAILDQLTMQMVIAEEAVKKGLDKTPDVTEKLEVIKQSILANAYVQDYIKNNPVTEEAMKAEYERIKATITGTDYKVRHILVEKESEAKDIIAKLKKDAGAFAKLAAEKSKDTGSKVRGGDLGWVGPQDCASELAQFLFMQEGGIAKGLQPRLVLPGHGEAFGGEQVNIQFEPAIAPRGQPQPGVAGVAGRSCAELTSGTAMLMSKAVTVSTASVAVLSLSMRCAFMPVLPGF